MEPLASSLDEDAGDPPSSQSLFNGLRVVDSPPSSPIANSFSEKNDAPATTTTNTNSLTNDSTASAAPSSSNNVVGTGTPQSIADSEESAVFVEAADAAGMVVNEDDDDDNDDDQVVQGQNENETMQVNSNPSGTEEIYHDAIDDDHEDGVIQDQEPGGARAKTKAKEHQEPTGEEDPHEEENSQTDSNFNVIAVDSSIRSTNTNNTNDATSFDDSLVMEDIPESTNQQQTTETSSSASNAKNRIEKLSMHCFVHPATPIPNSDTSLRILRKFVNKTQKHFTPAHGGTKQNSILSYLFGSPENTPDECCIVYKDLVSIISANDTGTDTDDAEDQETEDEFETNENEVVIESILGHSGDTMSKARLAIATFCRLIETWCLETQRNRILEVGGDLAQFVTSLEQSKFYILRSDLNEDNSSSSIYNEHTSITPELMSNAFTCAEGLVAHGCFDGVMIGIEEEPDITNTTSIELSLMPSITEDDEDELMHSALSMQQKKEAKFVHAVNILAESLFVCCLDSGEVELSALKFMLTTGCRTYKGSDGEDDEAMLRGSRLLQTIRLCYRVYLSTQSEANKTTARAALRQIVISAFKRLENKRHITHPPQSPRKNNKSEAIEVEEKVIVDPFSTLIISEMEEESKQPVVVDVDDKSYRSSAGKSVGNFSAFEHKDAYLVLRSLCKLSMKAVTDGGVLQNVSVYVARNETNDSFRSLNDDLPKQKMLMDPSLDSKILALDLLLEILQRTNTETLLNAGPQLIYAVRYYLCHSLLNNCTSDNNYVVNLSLRLFVPLIRHFRSHLKTEIEAFITNVFFVILDSKNSTVEHKLRVVILFEEICSDPATLAEIFLNYDCDLSAVDLFQRIVTTLAKVAKIGLHEGKNSAGIFVAGAGVSRAEKARQDHRELRLEAMKAVRQILSSLHASFAVPEESKDVEGNDDKTSISLTHTVSDKVGDNMFSSNASKKEHDGSGGDGAAGTEKQSLVQIYDSKKKRREESAKAILRFNQKPSAGIKFASEVGIINGDDPADVAQFLLSNKDVLDKTQIGEYLGREPDYQNGFPLKVLHHYLSLLDFSGLLFDDAIKFYLSGFRLPGEAQKIDRIMEKFAESYTYQNPDVFPTADAAFILAFSIIMLNTDLHNPAIKEDRRMTKQGFLRNNSGICDGESLPDELLISIFDRIKVNPISLKEDDELREKRLENKGVGGNAQNNPNAGLFVNNFSEMDRRRESDYQKERDQILRTTESLLRRKKRIGSSNNTSSREIGNFVSTSDSGLKDEYVIPMFDVTWAPALAVFSTVIESANGTMGSLLSIATDREIEAAAENAAAATEICLSGFRLAIQIAAICGNDTARSAYVHALSNFSLLGTGRLLEHRHIRCVQTLLELARDDGELLGSSWEYIFKALSEVARLNQVHELTFKASRVEAEAQSRRKKAQEKQQQKAEVVSSDSSKDEGDVSTDDGSYYLDADVMLGDDEFEFEEEMDKKAIDETNARVIYDNISDELSDQIYIRSGSLSAVALKDFIFQLCRVSRMEIAGYGGHVGSKANNVDLTTVHYRKQHTLLNNIGRDTPDIYSLQKLVEVTHYNMDSRPRLIFADIWNTVSSHLTSTALHDNAAVAIYAVDSFRQLSIQFLQREELAVFEFQRKFLKPFEDVMSQCQNSSVKEFLLKAIEQIILMFESDGSDSSSMQRGSLSKRNTSIQSGWRPILAVIGLASRDADDTIANLGYAMLTTQLRQSLKISKPIENVKVGNTSCFFASTPMRADKFIDLVDALLMFIHGPREEMSSVSIDHLVTFARYISDENIPLPKSCNTSHTKHHIHDEELNSDPRSPVLPGKESSEELEFWWPILLGLSKSVGDARPNIRIKGLVTLLAIINQHFFSPSSESSSSGTGDIQTLQLIFKGILTPSLEHAETITTASGKKLPLPDGFIRFMTRSAPARDVAAKGGRKDRIMEGSNVAKGNDWIDTTFDHLMDGSISLALKSIEVYKDDILVEEVLAMFNTCLVSDSALLVIRGMKRLQHFVTSDLPFGTVTEKTWATVCHMLRRCLSVRGLPFDDEIDSKWEHQNEQFIHEFLLEEEILPERRYIGSNAAMILGTFLHDKQVAERMGVEWYLFLISGLGSGIRSWDRAAAIFESYPPKSTGPITEASPPQYAETSLYARKWMTRLLLKIFADKTIIALPQSKVILRAEFESLINSYLKKEAMESNNENSPGQALEIEHMSKIVCDLLEGINEMDETKIASVNSLTSTLSACIQINNRSIRNTVHKLLQKVLEGQMQN